MFDVILVSAGDSTKYGQHHTALCQYGGATPSRKTVGISLDDRQMRRAGLDYYEYATVEVHDDWPSCAAHFLERRLFAVSTKGAQRYDLNRYGAGDAFLFGPETRGLPAELLAQFSPECRIRLPMLMDSRSLNLSNAVAVIVYEAWRQLDFGTAV